MNPTEILLILKALYKLRETQPSTELTALINKFEREYEDS